MSYPALIGISLAALAAVFLLVRGMHRLGLRAQFMVLLGMGVTISFILLVMVQSPNFPVRVGVALMVIVFIASLFGTRTFLRSLAQDERKEEEAEELDRQTVLQNPTDQQHPPRPGPIR